MSLTTAPIGTSIGAGLRTCHRALALRTIAVPIAASYAIALGVSGFGLLWGGTNLLALGGLVIYAGGYTFWLKRRSHWGTLVGSLSGAMPPVIGYCAVSARFDATAMMLVLVFCCWQMPHSHAITVMRREDFRAARLPLLSLSQAHRQIQAYILAFFVAPWCLAWWPAWVLCISSCSAPWAVTGWRSPTVACAGSIQRAGHALSSASRFCW